MFHYVRNQVQSLMKKRHPEHFLGFLDMTIAILSMSFSSNAQNLSYMQLNANMTHREYEKP